MREINVGDAWINDLAEMTFGPGAEGLKDSKLIIVPVATLISAEGFPDDTYELEMGDSLLGC